ncbi:adenylate/guanylate cyclase domain protein (macronuclear) [Tetrahymena thermophila SB210]|uniref:Adenylate/guanylate cyclase domain protein n=1 Tax=Tetrahymena thermophila (strain SB210) TaxID=312017 RepID=I7MD01_TETTS|nr:adenylate/guanylate cyclase domain protein [Tetrahymena thermophila SB210]EAR85238.3 adenylate/guanylate cyclase domain protein [Tetrahymena thermophila SB210]|eukprot:XP_001032901.3 adenylate/guanylate cyclase domain protein [Tetrahymena thermophila SB210]
MQSVALAEPNLKPNNATGQRKSILKNTLGPTQQFDSNLNNITDIQVLNNNIRRPSKFSQKSDEKIRNIASQQNMSRINLSQQPSSKGKERLSNKDGKKIDVFNLNENQKYPKLAELHDSIYFQLILAIFTIYALFGDDIRVAATTKGADPYFDAITITCISAFAFQIIIQSISYPQYRYSFFFWLDIVSTSTMLLDIQSLNRVIFFQNNIRNTIQLTRASRASRVGTRAGRVVRLIRLIRITRIYKQAVEQKQRLEKKKLENLNCQNKSGKKSLKNKQKNKNPDGTVTNSQNNSNKDGNHGERGSIELPKSKENRNSDRKNNQTNQNIDSQLNISKNESENLEELQQAKLKESKVSKRLSDLTTKKVVIVILLLLFLLPMFQKSFYFDLPYSSDFHLIALARYCQLSTSSIQNIYSSISNTLTTLQGLKSPCVYFTQPFSQTSLDWVSDSYDNYRDSELLPSVSYLDRNIFLQNHPDLISSQGTILKSDDPLVFISVVNVRDLSVLDAILSICRTIFVSIVLLLAAFFFSQDAQKLALGPIERMINKVNQIANDPLSAKDQELIDESQDQYETRIIENAIVKIGALLALGFGEAGSEIIGSNIAKHGEVDPMISGKKKCCIYGFCDIRNFTDATEVLQEDVMIFVNNIGDIVHTMVDRFMGAANKNIGDAFLLVWKFQEDKYEVNEDNTIDFKDPNYACIMAEFALLSFMKIQAKINREPIILEYRKDQRLNQRMANYKVKIGYGLHIGWSIEGAIGSEFKIDASYLSPNVSMSSRLEGATKGYGVPLLFSSDIYNLLTPNFHEYIRQVDYVKIKGQAKPIGFYTIDMQVDKLPPSKLQDLTIQEKMSIEKQKKSINLQFLDSNVFDVKEYLTTDKDMKLILKDFDFEFVKIYKKAFDLYLQGNWSQSKEIFDTILIDKKDDGPTKATLEFMSESDYQAPQDWSGFKPYYD